LPKQVLWDIIDVCNDSDQPFDHLKEVLLGQFRKSKWQSYFDLLCLTMEMQGLMPSALMGKLKHYLTPGVSLDSDLFLAMFLILLPPSMREAVGAGNHKTALAVVKAEDALWDALGGRDPKVAMMQRSQSPAPANGKKSDKRSGKRCSKSRPSSHPDFYSFHNPGNGVCRFYNYYSHKALSYISPCTWSEN
jgi:hypothetical protein